MLDGGGEKPSWEMISSKEEKGEMRTKDPWSSLSRPSSVIYIQRSAVIPSTWKYLASHHARFASIQTIIVLSLLLLRIFNTRPTPSFIEIVRGNVTQKLGLFLSFFPSICLPSLHFYPRRRWRTMVAQSIARGKFKFSFLYPTFDSVGKRVTQALEHTLLPPLPGSKDYFNRVAALSTNVKSASGVSARRRKGGEKNRSVGNRGQSGQYLLWIQVERFWPGNRLKLWPTNNTWGKTWGRRRERRRLDHGVVARIDEVDK